MRVSARCVVRTAVLAVGFTLVLALLLVGFANRIARAEIGDTALAVSGFTIALLARSYASVIGARVARREELSTLETVASSLMGQAIGYVTFFLGNAFIEVILLARPLTFGWDKLYGVLPWLLAGVLGALFVMRPRKRAASRR